MAKKQPTLESLQGAVKCLRREALLWLLSDQAEELSDVRLNEFVIKLVRALDFTNEKLWKESRYAELISVLPEELPPFEQLPTSISVQEEISDPQLSDNPLEPPAISRRIIDSHTNGGTKEHTPVVNDDSDILPSWNDVSGTGKRKRCG